MFEWKNNCTLTDLSELISVVLVLYLRTANEDDHLSHYITLL